MTFVEQAWYWRLAVLRVLVYMLSTFIASFLILTEDYGSSQWSELGEFLKRRIYLASLAPALIAFVAFMDQTMGTLRKTLEDRGRTITTVTTENKPADPVEPPKSQDP